MYESAITKVKELEEKLKLINNDLDRIKSDEDFKLKLEKLKDIEKIMQESDISNEDLASYFKLNHVVKQKKRIRREAPKSRWVNPHTGEIYEGIRRAGLLKQWIEEYGRDEVEKWRTEL